MKKITKIERQKNNVDRVSIYLDYEFAFGLDESIFLEFALHKDMELEEDYIENILKKEEYKKAENYAIYLISQREYTEKNLTDKILSKGYNSSQCETIIEKFKKYGYINDESYAGRFIRTKQKTSNQGKYKIKASLLQKGVSKDILNQCMEEFDQDMELEKAEKLVSKKIHSLRNKDIDKYKLKQKLTTYLASKGYEYDIIRKAINNQKVEDEDYEI